ncbi:PREDICTED: something about silencing protein 10 [Dufourea novaeangliae]|uniref:something about silencing protein 10 n=1 Tax=Dufourea novaeangliae TaxID=178035 RepID=UPI000767B03F|nr:PREDICTED: something about silencing protein 10 [Dufourea novaeangliae]
MKSKKRTRTEVDKEMGNLEDINMNELTNSEDEYSETERKLLQKVRNRQADSMESDIEGLRENFDLPNEKAWGKKKRAYYSTDYVDPDYATSSHKDLADAEMEEEEARNIQRRLAEQLDDADFGLDFIESTKDDDKGIQEATDQFVKTDLSKLSKRQKQAIMQKESPEFMALVNDFKGRMTEARDVLSPFLKLANTEVFFGCPAVFFVKTKYYILLNYCINISFYLMLKAKRLPVNTHPVIKRLAQYRQLLNQLESGQGNLIQEIKEILNAEKQGKPLYNVSNGTEVRTNRKKITSHFKEKLKHLKKSIKEKVIIHHLSESEYDTRNKDFVDEMEDSEGHASIEKAEDVENGIGIDEEEEVDDTTMADRMTECEGKRAITYQIAKNKGLTPHRKKEQRNPRVKHRNKYRKAKIRRKGAVREVRKEITRYAGEISGIKASVMKSTKLK